MGKVNISKGILGEFFCEVFRCYLCADGRVRVSMSEESKFYLSEVEWSDKQLVCEPIANWLQAMMDKEFRDDES